MCHRWLLAVIMRMLPWQPVCPLPLEKTSSEGFPTTTRSPTTAGFIGCTVPPSNIQVQTPEGPLPPALLSVQSINNQQSFPGYYSHLDAFSKHPPPPIPSANDFAIDAEEPDQPHSRSKRRAYPLDLLAVCDLRTSWRKKSWAIDILGQNVTVVENITTNNDQVVGQWFYETTCTNTQHSCKGVDHTRFISRCISRSSWVFAVVRQANGPMGWNRVSIGTACNCGYKRRSTPFHELLGGRDADSEETPT